MATGPKISSWATGMSVVMPESTVGANHQPSPSGNLAPVCTVAPWRQRLLDLADQLVALGLGHDGPDVGGRVEGIAHDQRVHGLDEAGLELVGHRVDHDEPLGRDARLAVVLHAGGDGGAHARHRGRPRRARRRDRSRPARARVFLTASPAAAATDMPAGSLPVRVTAAMRGSSIERGDVAWTARRGW